MKKTWTFFFIKQSLIYLYLLQGYDCKFYLHASKYNFRKNQYNFNLAMQNILIAHHQPADTQTVPKQQQPWQTCSLFLNAKH